MNQVAIPPPLLMVLFVGLFVMMVGVSLEVSRSDWRQCYQRPGILITSILLQLLGIPLLALLFVSLFAFHPEIIIGILLLSLCPGGVMSNFFTARAGGNVALSSVLTLISSALLPLTLPLGLYVFSSLHEEINAFVDINELQSASLTSALLIIPPLIIGQILRRVMPQKAHHLISPLRLFSFALVGSIIVITLIKNRALLLDELWSLLPATLIFNGLLLGFGYLVGKLLEWPLSLRRTLSIELGIQNATVALVVAPSLFPGLAGVMNMTAFWGVWHLITGLVISLYWSNHHQSKLQQN